jgi:hypothetical protein
MSIYKNLSDIFPKILNFEIKEHIDVDEIDEQVRKNLVIVFIKNEKYINSSIFIELTAYLSDIQFEIKIIFNIQELFDTINKYISNICYIFSFTSIMTQALNIGKKPIDIYMIFKSLADFNIGFYPNLKLNYIFESLVYLKMLNDNYPQFSLPYSKIVFYPLWNEIFYDEYQTKILNSIDTIKNNQDCDTIVMRKSFYNGSKSKRFIKINDDSVSDGENTNIIKKIIKSMEYTENTDNIINNISKYDEGGFKLVAIQPYCNIKSGILHSIWFVKGNLIDCYYCNGNIVQHYDNEFLNKLKEYCQKIYDSFIKDICNDNIPPILQIDIGVSVNKSIQDEHSFIIGDKKMRFFVNNIAINGEQLFSNRCNELYNAINKKVNLCKILLLEIFNITQNSKIRDIIKKL